MIQPRVIAAGLAVALSACSASRALSPGWVPERSQPLVRRLSARAEPIKRLCLSPREIAPRIMVFCGGFANVTGLATDAIGNLYVASGAYSRSGAGAGSIVRVAPDGRTSLVTGDRLTGLYDLAVDEAENVYASTTVVHGFDSSTARVYEIPPGGAAVKNIASGLSHVYGLAADAGAHVYAATNKGILKIGPGRKAVNVSTVTANAIAVDSSADLYITDVTAASEIESDGTMVRLPGKYVDANGIAADGDGDVFVSDRGHGTILKITPQRSVQTVARDVSLTGGFALGSDGSLYAGGRWSVQRVGPNGAISPAGPMLTDPTALAADAAGGLYVALPLSKSVVRIDPNSSFTVVNSHLRYPSGIAVYNGALYVADAHAGAVEVVSRTGGIRVIGKGLSGPSAIAVDSQGNAYVADGKYVKRIDSSGNVTRVFGLTDPDLEPSGVAVDAQANVYVAVRTNTEDCYGGVFKIAPNGTVSQIARNQVPCAYSIASDSGGTLYVAQRGGIVREIRSDGRTRILASRIIGLTLGLAPDGRGHLYVSGPNANAIYRVSL